MKKILIALLALVAVLGVEKQFAEAAGTCAIFRSWNTGDQLTASDQTSSFVTVGQTNMIPSCMDGDSVNVAGMQAITDPFPGSIESLATTLKGEIERTRFVIKNITGWTQWYTHNGNALTLNTQSALKQTPTWNAAVTFPGLWLLNVLDTSSNAGSLLLDLQVGSTSKFKVDKAGNVTAVGTVTAGTTTIGGGSATFPSISVTNNTNMVNLGTTNVGTFTLAGGALTANRTWTLPDITGIVMLTNGGQTVTSGVWNGSIIGTAFGGTGINTSATATGSILYTSGAGTWTTATQTATGTVAEWNGTAMQFDHTDVLKAQVFN